MTTMQITIRQWMFVAFGWMVFALPSLAGAQDTAPYGIDIEPFYTELGCVGCHGENGSGTHAGPRLDGSDLALGAFIAAVREPTRTMPAYGPEVVSDEDLQALYAQLGPGQAPRGDMVRGQTLYHRYGCYSCHADQAQGGMHGPRLGPDAISYARFSWYVRHPTAQMPPYTTSVLTSREMADIYAFVKSRPEPRDVASIPLLVP